MMPVTFSSAPMGAKILTVACRNASLRQITQYLLKGNHKIANAEPLTKNKAFSTSC